MKLYVPLLTAAAALCLTAPANADPAKSETSATKVQQQQLDVSSRKRHVKRVYHRRVVYQRGYDSYAAAPFGFGFNSYDPYYYGPRARVVSYDTYGGYNPYYYNRGWGYGGYDSYAYAPGPSIGVGFGFGGYGPHWSSGPGFSVGFGGPVFW